jgi:hypothetical protein
VVREELIEPPEFMLVEMLFDQYADFTFDFCHAHFPWMR